MKVISLLVISFLLCVAAQADNTTSANWDNDLGWGNGIRDYTSGHFHDYVNADSYIDRYSEFEKRQCNPLGIGVDLVLYEFDGVVKDYGLDSVESQNKWDLRNNRYSGYLVLKTNPWRVIKEMFLD